MFLLDTDTCIHLARGNSLLLANLRQRNRQDIHVSILSIYEMEYGLRKATLHPRKKRKALDELIRIFNIAPFNHPEATEAGKIRAELEASGSPIGSIDYLIAGTARAHRHTIVTGNTREFSRVRRLKVETWHR